MTATFDPKCYELAEAFYPDGTPEEKISKLAATIQDSIEAWLESEQWELDQKLAAGSRWEK